MERMELFSKPMWDSIAVICIFVGLAVFGFIMTIRSWKTWSRLLRSINQLPEDNWTRYMRRNLLVRPIFLFYVLLVIGAITVLCVILFSEPRYSAVEINAEGVSLEYPGIPPKTVNLPWSNITKIRLFKKYTKSSWAIHVVENNGTVYRSYASGSYKEIQKYEDVYQRLKEAHAKLD